LTVCTYLFFKSFKSQTILLCSSSLFPLLQLLNRLFIMFLPPTSRFDPIIYPSTDKPYPPAILVKHHTWFLHNADLFICCDHILYGVHQSHFDQSPLFREIILYGRTNEIGVNPYHLIPFDTLTKEVFNNLLSFYISEPNIWNISLQKTGLTSNIFPLTGIFLE
jgi:hypothetical protein